MDLLVPTDHVSHCPYKGPAEYWSARIGDDWRRTSSGRTVRRCRRANGSPGYVAFYDERVDLFVDGELQERPKTKFS